MRREVIDFYAEDGVLLNGYINKCEKKTDKILIQTHGMISNCFKTREKIITQEVEKIGIDAICFNNRGHDIASYIKHTDGKKEIAGTAFENAEDGYYDIIGAINYALSLGYKKIYLQGHSLGSIKMLYTYNKMKENNDEKLKYIKGLLLLSFVNITGVMEMFLTPQNLEYAEKKEKENKILELMPENSFLNPLSVKNYLKYLKYNKKIDNIRMLNNVDIPLFMRWGNVKELIIKPADEHVNYMNDKINNKNKDINFIDGANHSYEGKEKVLANEIIDFLKKYENN